MYHKDKDNYRYFVSIYRRYYRYLEKNSNNNKDDILAS
jgi:hypothetical protein